MKILITLIIGSLIGGIWVQYRITGDIWHNKTNEQAYEEGYITASKKLAEIQQFVVDCEKKKGFILTVDGNLQGCILTTPSSQ